MAPQRILNHLIQESCLIPKELNLKRYSDKTKVSSLKNLQENPGSKVSYPTLQEVKATINFSLAKRD
ncbi:unnamed protein product [Acidithrix sp. C25]|nr:unnamed protein product [Acidithrix sp. C25]